MYSDNDKATFVLNDVLIHEEEWRIGGTIPLILNAGNGRMHAWFNTPIALFPRKRPYWVLANYKEFCSLTLQTRPETDMLSHSENEGKTKWL